ncbi:hypothetical protein [Paractinoplanes ferrugineus]|nr:hypothetical protein [Actinoplanes ferrugineus]
MTAWKLLIGAGVTPDSVVPDDSPALLNKVDEEWLEIATRARVIVADRPFWIHFAGPGARRQGWRKVMITGPVQLAEHLGTYAGEPEFVAMDLGERVVCGVTSEEDETWIVSARLDEPPLTVAEDVDLSELDCKVFVHGAPGRAELSAWIAGAVDAEGLEFFVDDNEEAGAGSGFLFFDHVCEFYFAPRVSLDDRIRTVSAILADLWRRSLSAVAACDYEERLLGNEERLLGKERSKQTESSDPM